MTDQFQKLIYPHESVAHSGAYALLCSECFTPLKINWRSNAIGYARCSCGCRFAYKHVYEKFVRV